MRRHKPIPARSSIVSMAITASGSENEIAPGLPARRSVSSRALSRRRSTSCVGRSFPTAPSSVRGPRGDFERSRPDNQERWQGRGLSGRHGPVSQRRSKSRPTAGERVGHLALSYRNARRPLGRAGRGCSGGRSSNPDSEKSEIRRARFRVLSQNYSMDESGLGRGTGSRRQRIKLLP